MHVGVNRRTTYSYALIRLVSESSRRIKQTVNDGATSSFSRDRSCVEDCRSESLAFWAPRENGLRRTVISKDELGDGDVDVAVLSSLLEVLVGDADR